MKRLTVRIIREHWARVIQSYIPRGRHEQSRKKNDQSLEATAFFDVVLYLVVVLGQNASGYWRAQWYF
jgi:hypothetical protein